MKPITPTEILSAVGCGVPELVIQVVNDCLVDVVSSSAGMHRVEEIFVHKDMLRERIQKAAGGTTEDLAATHWENFPCYFAKDWDIQLPDCKEGPFRDFYIFLPKGLIYGSDC